MLKKNYSLAIFHFSDFPNFPWLVATLKWWSNCHFSQEKNIIIINIKVLFITDSSEKMFRIAGPWEYLHSSVYSDIWHGWSKKHFLMQTNIVILENDIYIQERILIRSCISHQELHTHMNKNHCTHILKNNII